MKLPYSRSIQVKLGQVEGFWRALQLLQKELANIYYVAQQPHWLWVWKETSRLHYVNNDVIMSDWVRSYRPVPSRVHDRTLLLIKLAWCTMETETFLNATDRLASQIDLTTRVEWSAVAHFTMARKSVYGSVYFIDIHNRTSGQK